MNHINNLGYSAIQLALSLGKVEIAKTIVSFGKSTEKTLSHVSPDGNIVTMMMNDLTTDDKLMVGAVLAKCRHNPSLRRMLTEKTTYYEQDPDNEENAISNDIFLIYLVFPLQTPLMIVLRRGIDFYANLLVEAMEIDDVRC